MTHLSIFEPWTVASNNTWGLDTIGFTADVVNYYRAYGRAPCSITAPQIMIINSCTAGGSNTAYRTNYLGYVIGDTTVTSFRDGVQAERNWSPP